MYLNASTDKIEIVLGGTVATNQLQWNVSYQDITSSGMTLPQSGGAGLTNNATAVDIVAAPAASTTRQVTQINVYNADTATATVTIQKDVSGTNYVLIRYALTTLDTLMWSREDGWRVMSGGSGNAITALTGDVTATGPGSAAATIANDAVTYAKMQNVSAASRLLGRGSAGGAGDVQEITLGSGLTMTGTTLSASGAAYTFSTGLTDTAGTVTNNLSTGVAGGQSVVGGTAASNSLTLSSTTNATKGKILFGTSAYDEVNNRLGIGTASPAVDVDIAGLLQVTTPTFPVGRFIRTTTLVNSGTLSVNDFLGSTSLDMVDGFGVALILSIRDNANVINQISAIKAARSGADNSGSLILMTNNAGTFTDKLQIFPTGNTVIQNGGTFTDAGFRLDVNGTARVQGRVTVNQDTTVTTQTVSVITSGTTNAGLVLQPNGTGAIMAQAPDGGTGGGNARGNYAVDLQMVRGAATQVASGERSAILGGRQHVASGINSAVIAGDSSSATGLSSVCIGGGFHSAANSSSICLGSENSAAADFSTAIARESVTTLINQFAIGGRKFGARGDNQRSIVGLSRQITGTAQTELTCDGTAPSATTRAILSFTSPPSGSLTARAWRAQVDVVAIAQTVGNGTVTLGHCFMGSYHVGIKRIGTATSLVGTVSVTNEVSDATMSTSVVTIDADDTNEALRIQFTPPSTAGTTTVIRVVATAYLTEVGY